MTPQILGLGVPELLIILAVVLLLFGGSRLAGIGRSSGRAIREFKEETKNLKEKDEAQATAEEAKGLTEGVRPETVSTPSDVVEAEIVEPKSKPDDLR